uniref:Uncharacterized protein n=1 Tax=Globodera rostochiensis TaxID=31243 RepID=A0A914I424_GLORO
MNSPTADDARFDFVTENEECHSTPASGRRCVGTWRSIRRNNDRTKRRFVSKLAARANVVASGEEHWKLLTELETLRTQMAQVKGLLKMQEQREAQMLYKHGTVFRYLLDR